MQRHLAVAVVVLIGFTSAPLAQAPDADVQKLTQQYQEAFNKGDAKALAALYATDAFRLGPDGQFQAGRDAIQKHYMTGFEGPVKGAKLTLKPGKIQKLPGDVLLSEGTYEVTGAPDAAPRGRYVNTLVRQQGQWRLAGVTVVPEMMKPQAKPASPTKP
jgi:uncharacterized protein (TIGR02246 family)